MSKAQPSVDIDAVLAANTRQRPGGRCLICAIIADMPADWQAKLAAAFADKARYSAPSLVTAMSHLGHEVGRSTVERHRNGECIGSRRG